jgi:hypothetical protein
MLMHCSPSLAGQHSCFLFLAPLSKGGMEGIYIVASSQSIDELVEDSIEAIGSCNMSSLSRDGSSSEYLSEKSPSSSDGASAVKCGVGVVKHGKASRRKKVRKSSNTRKKGTLTSRKTKVGFFVLCAF